MRLPDLKYNFIELPENQQMLVFLDYYQQREKDTAQPVRQPKVAIGKTGKKKGSVLAVSTDQLDLLRRLKLI